MHSGKPCFHGPESGWNLNETPEVESPASGAGLCLKARVPPASITGSHLSQVLATVLMGDPGP